MTSEERVCVVCHKALPKEGALRKDKRTGKIVPVHHECAKDKNLTGIFG